MYKTGVHVSRTQGEPPWWGLHPTVKAVNPRYLEKFHWLMTKCTFTYPDLHEHNVGRQFLYYFTVNFYTAI